MITVVGSINFDLTLHVPRFPVPGESIRGYDFQTACGGKGANQAFASAKMGAPTAMLGCVGDDAFGALMMDNLSAVGVNTEGIARRTGVASGTAMILVDADGQNEIAIVAGANGTLTHADLMRNERLFQASRAILTQLETTPEATETAMTLGHALGKLTVLNPAPYMPVSDALLAMCDFVIPNENEASQLTHIAVNTVSSAQQAARALRARGVRNVVLTLGARGAWVECDQWTGHVPGFRVQAIDTVGAGDTFIGAFITRMIEGAPIDEATRFGNAAAAIAVTRKGAQPSVPTRQEVEAMLRQGEQAK